MSAFTQKEIEYLNSQRLGRMATVNKQGDPHVVPVSFRYNPDTETIDIGGLNMGKTKKYREAESHESGGKQINENFSPEIIRIVPSRIIGWGLDTDPFQGQNSRKVG